MADSDSQTGVMQYGGKSYAVGLLWFTVQEDSAKALLQSRLQKTHADFYCQRQHIAQQQGFGWLQRGHKRGMAAAAAMVADQLVGEWHGVLEAENGWWYVQVRSDTITPQGDKFFTREEDAYNLFQAEMAKHNWPHSYAPEKWSIPDTREITLKNFLNDLATTKLVNANFAAAFGSKSARNVVIALIAIVLAAMVGAVVYTLAKPDDIIVPKTNFVPRTVNATPAALAAPVKSGEFISPQQLIAQCSDAAQKLLTSLPGWKTGSFTCEPNKASMSWQQISGTLTDAKAQGMKSWPANAAVTFNNKVLSVALALDKLPMLQAEKLPSQEQVLLALEQNFQSMGALQVKPIVAKAPAPAPGARPPAVKAPAAPVPASAPALDIQFLSGFAPDHIAAFLDAPGLEIVSLEWKIAQGLWQYKFKWTHDKPKVDAAAKPGLTPGQRAAPQAAGGAK